MLKHLKIKMEIKKNDNKLMPLRIDDDKLFENHMDQK